MTQQKVTYLKYVNVSKCKVSAKYCFGNCSSRRLVLQCRYNLLNKLNVITLLLVHVWYTSRTNRMYLIVCHCVDTRRQNPHKALKLLYIRICMHHILQFPPDPVPAPLVTVRHVTSSQVEYETTAHGSATRVIAGYEVTRFGVPMIGQYVNTGRGSRVAVRPVVPGAQYRITAWALGDGRRSAAPTVVDATTMEAGQCILCLILKTINYTHT